MDIISLILIIFVFGFGGDALLISIYTAIAYKDDLLLFLNESLPKTFHKLIALLSDIIYLPIIVFLIIASFILIWNYYFQF